MALQKKIVTPAGNTLGDFGIIISILAGQMPNGMFANQCVINIFNSEQDAIDKKPPVASYRYPLGNVEYDPTNLKPIYDKLLSIGDTGNWNPDTSNPQQNRGWVPGWSGATILATPSNVEGLP